MSFDFFKIEIFFKFQKVWIRRCEVVSFGRVLKTTASDSQCLRTAVLEQVVWLFGGGVGATTKNGRLVSYLGQRTPAHRRSPATRYDASAGDARDAQDLWNTSRTLSLPDAATPIYIYYVLLLSGSYCSLLPFASNSRLLFQVVFYFHSILVACKICDIW